LVTSSASFKAACSSSVKKGVSREAYLYSHLPVYHFSTKVAAPLLFGYIRQVYESYHR
jgi:hypothetical protein